MIVMKFGGTSMQSAEAMRSVIGIVSGTVARKVVVASACAGVTNQLIELADISCSERREDVQKLLAVISERHRNICHDLLGHTHYDAVLERVESLCSELERLCEGIHLLQECTPRSRAALLSFGERLSTEILTAGLQFMGHSAALLDARAFMRTDGVFLQATAQMADIERLASEYILPVVEEGAIVVTQGFIGSTIQGITTVLGRGGSDLSAAILGAALSVEEIQIWTDVSGILTADPRITPDARTVPQMSFAEAGELAYFGAKVLHPDTIRPAIDKSIPVRILNTFKPDEPGTLLVPEEGEAVPCIRAVTVRKECTLLLFTLRPDQEKKAFMETLYTLLHRTGVEVLAAGGAERHYSLCVHSPSPVEEVCREIESLALCQKREVALLCGCGSNIASPQSIPLLSDIVKALSSFDPCSFQQSAHGMSFVAALPEHHAHDALRTIHALIVQRECVRA